MQNFIKRLSFQGLVLFIAGAGIFGYLLYAHLTMSNVLAEYQFNRLGETFFAERESEDSVENNVLGDELTEQEENESSGSQSQCEYTNQNSDKLNIMQARLLSYSQTQETDIPSNPRVSTWEGDSERPEVFARMIIPKIELIAPVVHGVDDDDIKLAVGHMPETEKPGEGGNSVYAGHRSHTFGRFFNRLGEMEIGDYIIIETTQYKFFYVVFDIFIVYPDEVWVIEDIPDKTVLTLVTCEPLYGNSHRLIVRGKLN